MNVVLVVNSSTSAAASTPVYLSMSWGGGVLGNSAQVAADPSPRVLPILAWKIGVGSTEASVA